MNVSLLQLADSIRGIQLDATAASSSANGQIGDLEECMNKLTVEKSELQTTNRMLRETIKELEKDLALLQEEKGNYIMKLNKLQVRSIEIKD